MVNLQLVLRPPVPMPHDAFASLMTDELAPRLLGCGPGGLTLTYTAELPPRLTVIPFRRDSVALLSIKTESEDAAPWIQAAREVLPGAPLQGYRVNEVLPVAYSRDWADGVDTPGAGLLTLFRKRPALDRETFIRRWHGHHTPLSLEIHPLWSYVRCEVERPVLDGSPPLDGIVEEHFRERSDLLNPVRFFGGPLRMLPNMVRVGLDVKGFIDMATIENYLVRERHLRS